MCQLLEGALHAEPVHRGRHTSGQRGTLGQQHLELIRLDLRIGRQLPFAVEYDGKFIGQLTVNNITRGSAQFASVGYWIDERYAGRGLITRAVAMAIDHCFFELKLHRVEVAIRPENLASLRVVEKLGIPETGFAPRFLHIDGDWRDHRLFAICREDVPKGLQHRLDNS